MAPKMTDMEIKRAVRQNYAEVAREAGSCCGPSAKPKALGKVSKTIGYSDEDLKSVPDGANMGLGCGNPTAIASLRKGETVLDLGSGGGFDCFIAADKVGGKGRVIGVDMTPEMIEKARENAMKGGYKNVEFRLGEIENLPAADNSVDVIISNCVINLAPNKRRVFEEVYRVLRPGGRVMIADVVLLKKLPEEIMNSVSAYTGCVAGAAMKDEYIRIVKKAGFEDVKITRETSVPLDVVAVSPGAKEVAENIRLKADKVKELVNSVASVEIYAVKPARR